MSKKIITVEGKAIRLFTEKKSDFISLTDLTSSFDGGNELIEKWLSARNTIEFLGMWEKLYNPAFNEFAFQEIAATAGLNSFLLPVKNWVDQTGAIGLEIKTGRSGGVYAHKDIALEFSAWLSPLFRFYLVREFDRLKGEESDQLNIEWNVKRALAKVNYRLLTAAVRERLIPPDLRDVRQISAIYSNEMDLINTALFGLTSQAWQDANPDLKGNLRDHATGEQLLVLANLQNLNAHFIKEGLNEDDRLKKLNEAAIYQMRLLTAPQNVQRLKLTHATAK